MSERLEKLESMLDEIIYLDRNKKNYRQENIIIKENTIKQNTILKYLTEKIESIDKRVGDIEDKFTDYGGSESIIEMIKNINRKLDGEYDYDYYDDNRDLANNIKKIIEKSNKIEDDIDGKIRNKLSKVNKKINKMDKIQEELSEVNNKINEIDEMIRYGPMSQTMLEAKADFQSYS